MKAKKSLLALILVSISFFASAKEVVMTRYGTDEGWKQFEAALVTSGYMKAGESQFDTRGITDVMYAGLKPEQQRSVSIDGFHALNQRVNNLPVKLDIAEAKKRLAEGLVMPEVQVVEKVAQAPQAPPAPTVVPVAANADAVKEAIKAERETLAKMEPSPEVAELRKRLDVLAEARANAVTKDDIGKVATQVTDLRKELLGKIDEVDKKVDALGGRMTAAVGDITTLKGQINDPKTGLAQAHAKAEAAQKTAAEALGKYSDTDKRLKAVEEVAGTSLWSNIGLLVAIVIGLWALARTFGGQKPPVKAEKVKVATPESFSGTAAEPQRREPVRPSGNSNVRPLRTAAAGTDSAKVSGFPDTEPTNPIADDVGSAFEPPAWMRKEATRAQT